MQIQVDPHFMTALLFCALAFGQLSPQSLDLEFAQAQEAFVDRCQQPNPIKAQIDQLDSDSYRTRENTAKALLGAKPVLALMRARSCERRPEVRYWLNRLLRELNRCETCEGSGYCPEYRAPDGGNDGFISAACRRCGRQEYQHGLQWLEGSRYGYLACDACGGLGTYWNHYAVD